MGFRAFIVAGLLVAVSGGTALADARSDAEAQVEFGIAVARRNLWNEATYRWERATEIEGTIEDAAKSVWLVESNPPPPDEEPAQYLRSSS